MSSLDPTPDHQQPPNERGLRSRGATLIVFALAAILLTMTLSPRTVMSDRGIGLRTATESPGPIPSTERRPKPYP